MRNRYHKTVELFNPDADKVDKAIDKMLESLAFVNGPVKHISTSMASDGPRSMYISIIAEESEEEE